MGEASQRKPNPQAVAGDQTMGHVRVNQSFSSPLGTLVDEWVKLPGCFNANVGMELSALVMTTLAGAESIDGLAVLRHGAMRKLSTGAP